MDTMRRILHGNAAMSIRTFLNGFASSSRVPPMDTVKGIFVLLQGAQMVLLFMGMRPGKNTQPWATLCRLLLLALAPCSLLL